MTACAPLCGLADARRVTSRSPSQTKLCPKRVAGVRHPANSAQLKVAGEPGGRKKCRIKAGGRLCVSRPATPPRRAGRGFSIGGRNFNFLLWQVVGISKSREKPQCLAIPQGGCHRWFSEILWKSARGSFFTPWGQVGGHFFLCPYSRHNVGGSRRGYTQILRRKTKNKNPRKNQ